jgi:DNA-binding CsgD family transcriptional regulator
MANLIMRGKLTERELLIAAHLASGETTSQVARRLSVSPHTVAAHLGSMLSKTGVKNRTELITHLYAAGVFRCGERPETSRSGSLSRKPFDSLEVLRNGGHPVDSLSDSQRAVLASLDPHDVRVLNSIKERLDAVSEDAEVEAQGVRLL